METPSNTPRNDSLNIQVDDGSTDDQKSFELIIEDAHPNSNEIKKLYLDKVNHSDRLEVSTTSKGNEKSLNGSNVLICGMAYKCDVDDMRESPAVEIMEQLRSHGAEISYSDPWVPVFPKMRKYVFDLRSVSITEESVMEYDCLVLTTDWISAFWSQKFANSTVLCTVSQSPK